MHIDSEIQIYICMYTAYIRNAKKNSKNYSIYKFIKSSNGKNHGL